MKSIAALAKPGEHPFAPFVRILGKGRQGSRSLSREEARDAMAMILRGDVEEVQLGAFLMLLRVKEESGDELAGFVEAARAAIAAPALQVDLDWSSYAGKGRHLPWYLLAALTLADHGIRVFMHGASGHTPGRIYSEPALIQLLGSVCDSWESVASALDASNFAFLPLRHLCPPLDRMIDLRNLLGLRSPVHTLSRLLNPLAAPYAVQSIFHPPYGPRHQAAALALGQPHVAVFKGDAGEVERRPEAVTTIYRIADGVASEMRWPRLVDGRQSPPEELEVERLRQVWRGDHHDAYGELAITGTLAVVLELLGRADQESAPAMAQRWWAERNRERIPA